MASSPVIMKDHVNNDDQYTKKLAIPEKRFFVLIDLVLTIAWYTFNSQFCQETDRVAMGTGCKIKVRGLQKYPAKFAEGIPQSC